MEGSQRRLKYGLNKTYEDSEIGPLLKPNPKEAMSTTFIINSKKRRLWDLQKRLIHNPNLWNISMINSKVRSISKAMYAGDEND